MTIQVFISVLLVILFVVQNDPFYESRFKVFCQRAKKRSCVIFPFFVVSSAALFCHVTQRAPKRESALRNIPKSGYHLTTEGTFPGHVFVSTFNVFFSCLPYEIEAELKQKIEKYQKAKFQYKSQSRCEEKEKFKGGDIE